MIIWRRNKRRKIENQTLAVELKSPWNYLHELAKQDPAAGGTEKTFNDYSRMWTLSDSNR